jgi:hypothetical protein
MFKNYLLLFVCLLFAGKTIQAKETVQLSIVDGINNQILKSAIEKNASLLLSAFNDAVQKGENPEIQDAILTKAAKEKIKLLWKTSPMECSLDSIAKNCLTTSYNDYQIRNIPVVMFSASEETKNEEIAIDFTKEGRINNVMVIVKEQQYTEMLKSNISVADFVQKQKITDFVDRFRDAYNCKDIKALELIFSNDALIITGMKIKAKSFAENPLKSLGEDKYIMQVQSKDQYLGKLKNVFKKNQYLNVIFEDVYVRKHPNPEYNNIYGVTLKQYWNSSTYSDIGYIFLLINCKDEYSMEIFVRTWQPEKDTAPDEIFNFSSFKNMSIKN